MMQKKLLDCRNLLGDSLYLLRPVQKFFEVYPEEAERALIVENSLAGELFKKTFPELDYFLDEESAKVKYPNALILALNSGRAGELAFTLATQGKRQLHISEAFAAILGVDLEKNIVPLDTWQEKPVVEKEYALIAPFSRSCSRHGGEKPNKTLDDWKWENVIGFLRRHNYPVRCVGGPMDFMERVSLPLDHYLTGSNLAELEIILKKAHLLITVDNGISHIASSLGVDTIVLWPKVSCIEFIAPVFSRHTAICQIGDPNMVKPSQMLVGIKELMLFMQKQVY